MFRNFTRILENKTQNNEEENIQPSRKLHPTMQCTQPDLSFPSLFIPFLDSNVNIQIICLKNKLLFTRC